VNRLRSGWKGGDNGVDGEKVCEVRKVIREVVVGENVK
jgi:hypothetical protein